MSKIFLIVLLVASLTSAATAGTSLDRNKRFSIKEIAFEAFKILFNKTYEKAEELKRYLFKLLMIGIILIL